MLYLVGIFRTSRLGGRISSYPEEIALRRQVWESDYIEVLQQREDSLNIRRLLLIKGKSDIFRLRNLALFYIWEDVRVWAHRNYSFVMHLTYVGPVSCVFTSLPEFPQGSPYGVSCSLIC